MEGWSEFKLEQVARQWPELEREYTKRIKRVETCVGIPIGLIGIVATPPAFFGSFFLIPDVPLFGLFVGMILLFIFFELLEVGAGYIAAPFVASIVNECNAKLESYEQRGRHGWMTIEMLRQTSPFPSNLPKPEPEGMSAEEILEGIRSLKSLKRRKKPC